MTHDTAKDPRLMVARLACARLKKAVKQKPGTQLRVSRDRLAELSARAESAVMTLTYLYMPPESLAAAPPMNDLAGAAADLAEAYAPMFDGSGALPMLRATVRWCLRTLGGLGERLGNSGTTMASGVDLAVVRVRGVTGDVALRRTRVTDGEAGYDVVTNLPGVAVGDQLAAAFLPPREVGGAVSEAMFLGSGRRDEAPGTLLDECAVDAREAAGILHDELASSPS